MDNEHRKDEPESTGDNEGGEKKQEGGFLNELGGFDIEVDRDFFDKMKSR